MISRGYDRTILPIASALKVSTSEMNQRVVNAGVEILGSAGQVEGRSDGNLGGDFAHAYQTCVQMNILGGTSEIVRNVVAWNALGLPRS
jgi:alkylation response protein AidB-like acyl-CoA dehydrogenase